MATATFAAKMLCHGSDTAWNTASTARQGIYAASDSSMKTPRTGIIYYEGMGNTLKDKFITNISIAYTLGSSGSSWAKTLRLVESNYQTQPTKSGTPYPGSYITNRNALGEYFLSNGGAHSSTITLNDTNNSELFNNLATYLETGANIICLHSMDTSNKSGYSYSTNYLELSKFTLTVTYEDRYPVYIEPVVDKSCFSFDYQTTARKKPLQDIAPASANYWQFKAPGNTQFTIFFEGCASHTFKGWTLTGPGSISEDQGECSYVTGAGESHLTATWDINKYTITYNANGKTVTNLPADQIKTYGTDLTLSTTVPSIAGNTQEIYPYLELDGSAVEFKVPFQTKYHFLSWNTAADGSGISYKPGSKLSTNSNVTLYLMSGTSGFFDEVDLPVPKKPGYKFLGWTAGRSNAGYISFDYTDQLYPCTGSGALLSDLITIYAYENIDTGTLLENYKPSDEFVYFAYETNNRDELVPVIYKTDTDEYQSTYVDWNDEFFYEGTATLPDGTRCDKWRKVNWDLQDPWGTTGNFNVYTSLIVDHLPERMTSIVPFNCDSFLELYSVWKSNGITYIDTGSEMVPHTIWIDTGSEWKQYIAYIDTGSEWHMCGAAE